MPIMLVLRSIYKRGKHDSLCFKSLQLDSDLFLSLSPLIKKSHKYVVR